jgi:hypothetical protein
MVQGLRALALGVPVSVACAPSHAPSSAVVIGNRGVVQNTFPFGTLPACYGYASARYQQVCSSGVFFASLRTEGQVPYPSSNVGGRNPGHVAVA